ncbi:hypothetical protein CLOM_g5346 [Closterium sp. NIES-68]|nr:hypothetical protein CLOM_g5346 [Closterium sp. NIES-68]
MSASPLQQQRQKGRSWPQPDLRLMPRHPEVYEPCDDSFALADAIATDIARFYPSLATSCSPSQPSSDNAPPSSPSLRQDSSRAPPFPALILELGSGSGFVLASVALALRAFSARSHASSVASGNAAGNVADTAGRSAPTSAISLASQASFLAVDINPQAADITRQTLAAHTILADVLISDLGSGLVPRMAGQVDVLIFNPPYVPTSPQEVRRPGITQAWAGGNRGREVIDRVMAVAGELLSPGGVFYLLVVAENDPGEVEERMRLLGFEGEELLRRGTEEEVIVVIKFWRR